MSPNYVLAVLKRFDTRPAGGDDLTQRCQLAAAICDLSIVVAFGHNELWRPKAAKVVTKLAKISPIGNIGYHVTYTVGDIIHATLLFWLYLERENKKL